MTSSPHDIAVAFLTMGCAKNEVDSANMRVRLLQAGYAIAEDLENANAVVVNTCSFIQAATEESIDAILEVAALDTVSSGQAKLIVAGCMPARYGADLEEELSEASQFVPCADESSIVSIMDELFDVERLPGDTIALSAGPAPTGEISAYVKISDGCDRFCSYCTIPYIRGRYHSFPYEDISKEVSGLVGEGVREIVLIAQDTGRWGADLEPRASLSNLLERLAEEHADTWFRVMYIQPEGITDELIETVATHENICSYFDIPLQHCNEQILRAMNRKGNGAEYLSLLERIRSRIPDVTLRTTLIAGFPGEDDEAFDELCSFVEEAPLDYIGVFAYSREEGTRAYNLPDQVDEEERQYRAQRLRDLADDVCTPRIARRIGQKLDVIVLGCEEDGQLFGRAMCQAPDVDGVTYVNAGEPGQIMRVTIEDTLMYEMEGTCLS